MIRSRQFREETMSYETILLDREDGVGIITLNRPETLNAMNRELGAELSDAMKQLNADDGIGCIIVTGAGEKAFSAGGDIKEQLADDKRYTQEELDKMATPRRSYEIAASAKPTIGMMNGLAYGGAAVLASSLDMRIGCEGTKFRFLAAAYGRINSTWSLGCQIGWPMAKELLFSARVVEAEEAYRIGLLNHLVPRAQLRAKTMELAKTIAGNHRGAVMGVKALLLKQQGESQEAQWAAEYEYTTKVMRGAKARDAFPEFLARKGIKAD
jgi:enoyl-CoA hydratase/carnithine racemase